MIALNVASKARAAFRRRGKMLVGHVRYQWVEAVGGSRKMGFLDSEMLRLLVTTESGHGRVLDITLPNNVDSMAIASGIARRVACLRLASVVAGETERAELEQLAKAEALQPTKGQFSLHHFSGAARVGETSARTVALAAA